MTPRTQEQFDQIRIKSRRVIMNSALELFAQKGYHGTSISMIAQNAGFSKGLMYNYFSSKIELLEAIILEGISLIEEMMVELDKIHAPHLQIEAIIDSLFSIVEEEQHFWTLYFTVLMQPDLPERIRALFSDFLLRNFETLEKIFRQLNSPNPAAEARVFGAIIDGVILHYWLDKKNYPLEAVKELLIEKYTYPD